MTKAELRFYLHIIIIAVVIIAVANIPTVMIFVYNGYHWFLR